MEFALATEKAKTRNALARPLRQLLLLIAITYAIARIVPFCMGLISAPLDQEPPSRVLTHGASFDLHAELVCESPPLRQQERLACNLSK